MGNRSNVRRLSTVISALETPRIDIGPLTQRIRLAESETEQDRCVYVCDHR